MNTSQLVGNTIWLFILLIIAGVLLKVIDNNFTTWFCFAFLCITGLLKISMEWPDKKKGEKHEKQ